MAARDKQHSDELSRLAGLSAERDPSDAVLAGIENWDASPSRSSDDGLRRRSETYLEAANGISAGGAGPGDGGFSGDGGEERGMAEQGMKVPERFSKKAAKSSPEALNTVFNSSYSLLPPISVCFAHFTQMLSCSSLWCERSPVNLMVCRSTTQTINTLTVVCRTHNCSC
jgi:hypothetical protein